jgi:hypothetical protein
MRTKNAGGRDFLCDLSITVLVTLGMIAAVEMPVVCGQEKTVATTEEKAVRTLAAEHRKAVERPRRIIFQIDTNNPGFGFTSDSVGTDQLKDAIEFHTSMFDAGPNQVDSVWYEWGGGGAQWPSKIMPRHHRHWPRWREAGIDPIKALLDATRKRGKEVFFSLRIGSTRAAELSPLQKAHPDWVHPGLPREPTYLHWNFAKEGVRDYMASVVREIAEMYDFDGIQIDLARDPCLLLAGEQWLRHDAITDFMRKVKRALSEVEQQKQQPILLAARVPENLMGCHYDGMDVETWVQEGLLDMLVLGNRSREVDVPAFRRITQGTGIKLYPSWDEHHASDGYYNAPIEVYRGIFATWWHQGADGVHTFNLCNPDPKIMEKLGIPLWSEQEGRREVQVQICKEIGSLETLRRLDKVFFVERRGGGHGNTVVPDPEDWSTPRNIYFWTNMFAPLPATLANDGKADTLLMLYVADDVMADKDKLGAATLWLALSDPAAADLPAEERLEPVIVAPTGHINNPPHGTYWSTPPANGIEKVIEARINNILLGPARIERGDSVQTQALGGVRDGLGWLVFDVEPKCLAVGENLIGIRLTERSGGAEKEVIVEKIELHVDYN